MRLLAFALIALVTCHTAHAGSIETFTGDVVAGKVELDFGGIVYHPAKGPVVKMDLGTIYRVQFDLSAPLEEFKPGVVLRNGDQCYWEGEVGQVYCTAAHATILAMPWHYLPLYQR